MQHKQSVFKIKGMSRDLSFSTFSPDYAFDNRNIRITPGNDNSLYAITNEKGTLKYDIPDVEGFNSGCILGVPIGYCVIDDTAVIFSTEENKESNADHIYSFKFDNDTLVYNHLYSGNLNFDIEYPIETLASYENDNIKKVYWVDGKNQPRVLNIEDDKKEFWNDDYFNFVRSQNLTEKVFVERIPYNGIFSVGTIQYIFTYFNSYGQESNAFNVSHVMYCSKIDSGISPEGKAGCSFKISINGLDNINFEYLRIYSVQRSAKNATPEVRRVIDLSIKNLTEIEYIDNGEGGSTEDYNVLFYLGGTNIIAGTLSQKDNTLFLGDIELNNKYIDIKYKEWIKQCGDSLHFKNRDELLPSPRATGYYPYINNLNLSNNELTTFKYLEWYRFGIQFQYNTGKWSEVLFIKDLKNEIPQFTSISNTKDNRYEGTTETRLVCAEYTLSDSVNSTISSLINNYQVKRVRPVVVFPSLNDRECICQGVLNPTMYNVEDRLNNTPFVMSSYYYRPNGPYAIPKLSLAPDFFNTYDDTTAKWSPSLIDGSEDETIYSKNAAVSTLQGLKTISDPLGNSTIMFTSENGSALEYRHNRCIPPNGYRNAEIQCITNNTWPSYINTTYKGLTEQNTLENWKAEFKNSYFVDQSIVTMHSPEIEFDSDILLLNKEELSLRIVGAVPITSNIGNISITTKTAPDSKSSIAGFNDQKVQTITDIRVNGTPLFAWRSLGAGGFYIDSNIDPVQSQFKGNMVHIVYPWNRGTTLINWPNITETTPSLLDKKRMSNHRVSLNSIYGEIWQKEDSESISDFISDIKFFDSEEITALNLKSPKYNTKYANIVYYGNYDKVLSVNSTKPYSLYSSGLRDPFNPDELVPSSFLYDFVPLNNTITKNIAASDPVRIKFKSTKHAVIVLNDCINIVHDVLDPSKDKSCMQQRVLPTIRGAESINCAYKPIIGSDSAFASNTNLFWNDNYYGVKQKELDYPGLNVIKDTEIRPGWLWLGELYRPDTPELRKVRFGGTSEEALENNVWIVAGDSVSLVDENKEPLTSVTIKWTQGDTYYQRYDNIKTYPFTQEDQQSMLDILSFMCETRINLDGRYDLNRDLQSYLHIIPENFNKLNMAYTQNNNLYTYRTINSNRKNISKFPNTITWTKTKALGDIIDNWTNISMASVIDMDGDKGKVNAIRRIQDKLIVFQDTGISHLLYNEKEQLATTEGQAVEIANSGKVSGKRYLTTNKGCLNKWSIQEGQDLIYFVDDISKGLFLFNGESFDDISNKLGMKSWFNEQCNISTWNPKSASNFITYYNKNTNDLLLINKNNSLAYNDKLQQFTSFYSYEDTPYIFNIKNRTLGLHWNMGTYDPPAYGLWEYNKGEYNKFYNAFKSYSISVISNEEATVDKVFSNIDYRGSLYIHGLEHSPFNDLIVENEYQKGELHLNDGKIDSGHPENLKKKFRVWRANAPRNGDTYKGFKQFKGDRIRNTWSKITLRQNIDNISDSKAVLQDITVNYYI